MASTGFFIRHDLTHFAVESVLGLSDAFYGLVASGWDINSFEEREPGSRKASQAPPSAYLAETIVGVLDRDWIEGPSPASEAVSALEDALAGRELELPTPHQIEEMRAIRGDLLSQWHELPPGASIECRFG
jgi:hypothetical protein